MDPPEDVPPDFRHTVRASHDNNKDSVGRKKFSSTTATGDRFVATNDKTVAKKKLKHRDKALLAAHLPDHGGQLLDFKHQVRGATPRPTPLAAEQHPEDADLSEECILDEDQEEEEPDDPITPDVAFASAWVPEDHVSAVHSGLGISSSAIIEMHLQNEQSKRKWIFRIVLMLCVLVIVLTVLVICRDGQCFKDSDKDIEPDQGVPVQITISPGTYYERIDLLCSNRTIESIHFSCVFNIVF